MPETLTELVRETVDVVGAAAPAMLEPDAPVLDAQVLAAPDTESLYLVGLIGGKEVGKSALVNALAGSAITQSTSYGPGTEIAVAYAHRLQQKAVTELFTRIVPDRFTVVTHDIDALTNLVLVDLPDIDSHYKSHLQTTRAVLRHLLYPVWIVSIEKYADLQPQQMLTAVSAGNAVENFLFCLNKADQIEAALAADAGGDSAAARAAIHEIRDDYASRTGRTLGIETTPRVFVISATHPDRFDLPQLAALLMRQRKASDVQQSRALAARRQELSLLNWLRGQDLPTRARRWTHLRQEAEETLAIRLGPALLERAIPRLQDSLEAKQAIVDRVLEDRVARWPLVNLVHTLLSPLFVFLRGMTARQAGVTRALDVLVECTLRETDEPVATMLQAAFARMRREEPLLVDRYAGNHLWESAPAESAAQELSRSLAQTMLRQRQAASERLGHGQGNVTVPLRWLLTIGAALWFPIVQPILQAALSSRSSLSFSAVLGMLVAVLGASYLLQSVGFLCIWFVVLWLALRWQTQRWVSRLLNRWQQLGHADESLSLTQTTLNWMESLLEPLREAESRATSLAERFTAFDQGAERAA